MKKSDKPVHNKHYNHQPVPVKYVPAVQRVQTVAPAEAQTFLSRKPNAVHIFVQYALFNIATWLTCKRLDTLNLLMMADLTQSDRFQTDRDCTSQLPQILHRARRDG